MSETFAEFIKKNRYTIKTDGNGKVIGYIFGEGLILSIEKLGEWAWKEIKEEFDFAKKEVKKAKGTEIEDDVLCEFHEIWERQDILLLQTIAVACLGEKEITKRLESEKK